MQRAFHHTAPVSSIYAFHEAIRLIHEEGLEARWKRHQDTHAALVRGLDKLGLELFTPASHRLPMLNVITIPHDIDDVAFRRAMLGRGIEVAGGFGPLKGKTWRVGLMGTNARPRTCDSLAGCDGRSAAGVGPVA